MIGKSNKCLLLWEKLYVFQLTYFVVASLAIITGFLHVLYIMSPNDPFNLFNIMYIFTAIIYVCMFMYSINICRTIDKNKNVAIIGLYMYWLIMYLIRSFLTVIYGDNNRYAKYSTIEYVLLFVIIINYNTNSLYLCLKYLSNNDFINVMANGVIKTSRYLGDNYNDSNEENTEMVIINHEFMIKDEHMYKLTKFEMGDLESIGIVFLFMMIALSCIITEAMKNDVNDGLETHVKIHVIIVFEFILLILYVIFICCKKWSQTHYVEVLTSQSGYSNVTNKLICNIQNYSGNHFYVVIGGFLGLFIHFCVLILCVYRMDLLKSK